MRSFELALMSEKELLHLSGIGLFVHDIIDETPIQETKMPPDLNKILS